METTDTTHVRHRVADFAAAFTAALFRGDASYDRFHRDLMDYYERVPLNAVYDLLLRVQAMDPANRLRYTHQEASQFFSGFNATSNWTNYFPDMYTAIRSYSGQPLDYPAIADTSTTHSNLEDALNTEVGLTPRDWLDIFHRFTNLDHTGTSFSG